MQLRDLQAFIPGWNIVYLIGEFRAAQREIKRRDEVFAAFERRVLVDQLTFKHYAAERDAAHARGDSVAAQKFDEQIADIALSYLK